MLPHEAPSFPSAGVADGHRWENTMQTMLRTARRSGFDTMLRARGDDGLSLDEMRARLPAIFADAAHSSRSDRYVYISTHDTVSALMSNGFVPVEARVSRTRDEDRRGFTKHMIRLRSRGDAAERRVGDTSFEVILRNAHDGTGSYQFMAGLFRLICLNGMVASEGTLEDVRVRHSGNREKQLAQVIEGAYTVLDQAPKVLEAPKRWSQIQLAPPEREAFAEAAHHLRFADAEGEVKTAIKPEQLLQTRRSEDQSSSLWTTFNVVQENAIRGGLSAWGRDAQNRLRRSTSREVKGIDQDVKLNRALWTLATKMAELKA